MFRERAVRSPKARRGDKIAVLSPAFAAPAVGVAVHEQAMQRLAFATGLTPVEFPTTRLLGASPIDRAADVNAAFGDPEIAAVLATIGGGDQITVIPHLDAGIIARNPKPFLGYSDNTNLHNYLWQLGVPSFYGGSTQVHLGAGPAVDDIHMQSLRASLMTGGLLTLTEPGESEDFGRDWNDPRALVEFGSRERTGSWVWAGPRQAVTGPSWGGCLEVIDQIALAGRMPPPEQLQGAILLCETSEALPSVDQVGRWIRALGERGILKRVAGVLVARPPVTALGGPTIGAEERERLRVAQGKRIIEQVGIYNPAAVVCVGVPFGHTRPQWIVPHGGLITLDAVSQTITADYS